MTYLKLGKKQSRANKLEESSSLLVESGFPLVISSKGPVESDGTQAEGTILLRNKGIDDLLECPICRNSMLPPIQQLFNCFERHFCLHFEAFRLGSEPTYMAFLRFMGDEDEARTFGYCLEVGGSGRKMTWQGVPRSIRAHHKVVRDSHDGLIVHRNLALYFSGGNQKELKLRVTGRIWKVE